MLERTTRMQPSSRQDDAAPYGTASSPGREPEYVYRRRRAAAAIVGGLVFLILLIVVIASATGGDPAPESTPADLGVGGGQTIKTPSTDRSKSNRKTDTTGDTSAGTVTPSTPPATGGTGGTTATPVAPTQPQGDGGGVGQAPAPAPPRARAAARQHRRASSSSDLRPLPESLHLAAAALRLRSPLPRGGARLRCAARSSHGQRALEAAAQPLQRELAVAQLAPRVLRHRPHHRAEPGRDPIRCSPVSEGEAGYVEHRFHARGGHVGVLAARP